MLSFVDEMNHVENVGVMKKMALSLRADFAKELENNRKRRLELEEKSKMDEIRCMMLEAEVEHFKKKNKELEEQIARIQKVMSNEEKGKETTIIDLTGEENERDEFPQLMIGNKVLECEKVKAETELHFWKEKVKQLVSQVCELESKLNMKGINENCSKVRKRLSFEEEDRCSTKKIAPSTPGSAQPPSVVVIDISDEDVSYNQILKVHNLSDPILNTIDEDDVDCFKLHSQISTKRKRSSNVVTSDDETSYDDNAPICTLIKKDASSRPLKRLRKLDDITLKLDKSGNGSSEDESFGGFIVEGSEIDNEYEGGINEFEGTLNKIRRNKDLNLKWGLEGDMLADFGRDPELCMRAVCALYRQQIANEKACNGTLHQTARGFSQADVLRASKVAEFLTDGDSSGDLNKTVEELRRYDSKGIESCMLLAVKYSKQLFEIYHNKEDPYFMP